MGVQISASTITTYSFPCSYTGYWKCRNISFWCLSVFSCQSLRYSSCGKKNEVSSFKKSHIVLEMTDLCFPLIKYVSTTPQWAFSIATHSGNSFVSPLPWYFPRYDNNPKPRASAMQKLFTRNLIAAILMPTTEDIRKLLEAGSLGTKWKNTIRHQVKSSSIASIHSIASWSSFSSVISTLSR